VSAAAARVFVPGNYCGHDPKKPRLEVLLEGPKKDLLRTAFERVAQVFTERGARRFEELRQRRGVAWKRSERLEAVVKVARVFLHHCDELTGTIGKFSKSAGRITKGIPLEEVARHAQLSESQTAMAAADMLGALRTGFGAYVYSWQPKEAKVKADGSEQFFGLAAIRKFTRLFWRRLGLIVQWDHLHGRDEKAARKAEHAQHPKARPDALEQTRRQLAQLEAGRRAAAAAPEGGFAAWREQNARPPPE
jgi:hypothetical protein